MSNDIDVTIETWLERLWAHLAPLHDISTGCRAVILDGPHIRRKYTLDMPHARIKVALGPGWTGRVRPSAIYERVQLIEVHKCSASPMTPLWAYRFVKRVNP